MKLNTNVYSCTDFSFSKHTTYGLGGLAKIAYFPETIAEGAEVFDLVKSNYDKYVILGNGSNVLASGRFYDGAVICTSRLNEISLNDGILSCQSGVTVKKLLDFCAANGLTGLEYLACIPATVGGLAYMNGGINCRHIGDDIISVSIYDDKLHKINNKNCNFGNKHSIMRDINSLILSIELKVEQACSETVKNNIAYFLNLRKIHPKGKSCGCVFKNPEGLSAGRLIDEAGLKGLVYGGAEVSREHANFIINNAASPDEVYWLIHKVKQKVYEKFGVNLEEEVIYIGEFNGTDG